MKVLEALKEIELFDGKTLDDIFRDVFEQSTEERNEAMEALREFKAMIKDPEDLFMNGDSPHKYLKLAQDSTANLVTMINAAQKIVDQNKEEVESVQSVDISSVIDSLDAEGIGPARFSQLKKAV